VKRCLVMITTAFPFASGEPYLETEMPYLSKRFDKILLFTIGLNPGVSPTVTVPENVIVCNPSQRDAKKAKLFDFLKGLPCLLRFPKKFKSEEKDTGHSPLKRAFSGYLISRSRRHCKEIEKCIADFDFSLFDEVVLYGYWFFAAAMTAVLLKEKLYKKGAKKVYVFSRAHRYDIYEYANRLNFLPLRRFLFQNTDKVLPCSENGREHLLKNFPQYEEKVKTAFLGTENGVMTSLCDDGVLKILTCSRAVPVKRLDRLASALALLKDSGIKISWTHIGSGESLENLKKFAKENLSFVSCNFTGLMPHDDVLQKIKNESYDVFINVSKSEGLPVSVMEASSFGIPSIVTDVGGCSEIVEDGKSGYLLPEDFSNEMLAQKIKAFASLDTESVSSMRSRAFDTWKNKFDAKKNFTDFADKLQRADFD